MNTEQKLTALWHQLYGDQQADKLKGFVAELHQAARSAPQALPTGWFKDVVVYSLYVDLFNKNFEGLIERLTYLQDLGVTCLWLLPILDSPMRDAGFDIRDFRKIRSDLVSGEGPEHQAAFKAFVDAAHAHGIRVIFDVAINHASNEHHWFKEAAKGPDNPFRDFFIWSENDKGYPQARIIFKGMMQSNWQNLKGQGYYFHRFFEIQPDLNFRNPDVLLEMSRMLLSWVALGVDGFRADAVPYLWKEEGTICENLPGTHAIVKFFRAVLESVRPGTMILAEACQPPKDVVAYFGDGDECHAAYHFPVMPRIYLAMAEENAGPIFEQLSTAVTPEIPADCGWFSFLRCHDELTLEMVTPAEREAIHAAYCHDPAWDFRQGEGVGARLANLLKNDARAIELAFSISFTLLGTPVVYYGDEFAKQNDDVYQRQQEALTGYRDARYRCRGPVDWAEVKSQLANSASLSATVFKSVQGMLAVRRKHKAFAGGDMAPVAAGDKRILAFTRQKQAERLLIVHNLGSVAAELQLPAAMGAENWHPIYNSFHFMDGTLHVPAKAFGWFVSRSN
jgi:maltose alpha-D-glucosyltransferase/alpha-amylase